MLNSSNLRHKVLLSAVSLFVAAPDAMAATVVQPDVRVTATYSENGGLTGSAATDTFGAGLDAILRIAFVDELNEFTILPRVAATRYDDVSQPDREEQSLQLDWRRTFETAYSDVLLKWERQDLLSSELREAPLEFDDDITTGVEGSGIVDVESTRDRLYFDWNLAKEINSRNELVLNLDYVDLDYDQSDGTSRVPFNETRVDAGWRWRSSERSDFTLTVGGQRFEGDNALDVDAIRADLMYYVDVSEVFDVYAGVGFEESDVTRDGQDLGSESNFTFRFGGQRYFQRTRLRGEILSDVRPNSSGIVSQEFGASLGLEHRFTAKLTLRMSLSGFTTEELSSTNNSVTDRDYLSGRIRLAWRLTPTWSLEGTYSHSRQDFDSDIVLNGENEQRDRVSLSLRYQGLRSVPFKKRRR